MSPREKHVPEITPQREVPPEHIPEKSPEIAPRRTDAPEWSWPSISPEITPAPSPFIEPQSPPDEVTPP